jgi:hypothetical protein
VGGLINVEAMIIGSTSYDDTAFMSPFAPHEDTEAAYTAAAHALWSPQPAGPVTDDYRVDAYATSSGRVCKLPNASAALERYPRSAQASPPLQGMGAFVQQDSDYTVTCPSLHIASLAVGGGASAGASPSASPRPAVWSYQWAHYLPGCDLAYFASDKGVGFVPIDPPTTTSNPQWASHASELPFVFGNTLFAISGFPQFSCPFSPAERTLSDSIMNSWANFAATLDPNGYGVGSESKTSFLPHWKRYQTKASSGGDTISSTSDPALELNMVLSLPQSKLLPSDLSWPSGETSQTAHRSCSADSGRWAESCSEGRMPQV